MRIVQMTSVHYWKDNRIFNKMCRSLASQCVDVHLVGVMPDNHDGKTIDGVKLHTIRKPKNRRERFLKTTPEVLAKARLIHGDLYHFHDPEFLPYIRKYNSLIDKPFIYDVHENYPAAILSKSWLPEFCRHLISRVFDIFERKRVMDVDGLIVAWPKIMERFRCHPRKILVNNYPYRHELQIEGSDVQKRQSGCFVYVGGLTPKRGILEMVKAVGMSKNRYKLMLGGNWSSEKYMNTCMADQGWGACEYKGYMDRREMRDLYAIAQAGIIAFHPERNHIYSVPNKIFEYMSAGLPVIASDLPMQKSIVEETGCGLVVDARSPYSIYTKMQWICEHPNEAKTMGNAGKKAIDRKFNWEGEVKKLIRFYEEVLDIRRVVRSSAINIT